MKLLIISSEPLSPGDLLSSIFELTQAVILKRIAEVCILSVSPQDTVMARLKYTLRRKTGKGNRGEQASIKGNDSILSTVLFRRNKTNTYNIIGIPVVEGKNYCWFSRGGYLKNLDSWVKAGFSAFHKYQLQFGKPDIIHAHGRFMNAGLLALKIHDTTQIPFIYTEHSTAYKSGIAPPEAKPILNEIIEKASAVITVSNPLLKDLELFLGKKIKNVRVLPNTIDPIFEFPLSKSVSKSQFNFICIASFHPKKGLDILLRSFKQAFNGEPRFRLVICGDGPLKEELYILRVQLGLMEVVQFTGNITKEEVRKRLDSSNVLVVSSLQETFGVVVIEALARGCPVIATRCGGPEDIVNMESGILIKAGDKYELTEALRKMDATYINYDLKKIHEQTIEKFGSKAFVEVSKNLYGSVLKKIA